MAQRRLSMRKIREVLRLRHVLGKSQREISKSLGIGKTSVQEHIRRAEAAGISWPVPDDMTEEKLERRLYPGMAPERMAGNEIPFGYIYEELRRPHVTMALLWEEYKRDNPSGYQYSWFCEQVRHYLGRMNYSMRQEHKAGEKGFVDFGSGNRFGEGQVRIFDHNPTKQSNKHNTDNNTTLYTSKSTNRINCNTNKRHTSNKIRIRNTLPSKLR